MKILTVFNSIPDNIDDVIYKGLVARHVDVTELNYVPTHNARIEDGRLHLFDTKGNIIAKEADDGLIHFDMKQGKQIRCHKWNCTTGENYRFEPGALDYLDSYDAILVDVKTAAMLSKNTLIDARERIYMLDGTDDWLIRKIHSNSQIYFKRELMSRRVPDLGEAVTLYFADRRLDSGASTTSPMKAASLWTRRALAAFGDTARDKSYANFRGKLQKTDAKFKSLNLTVASHGYVGNLNNVRREYDIVFITSSIMRSRVRFAERVARFAKEEGLNAFVKVTGRFYGEVAWNEYVEKIQSSKLAIAYPGRGFDTIRYWEIPCYGSALVSPVLPIVIDNNFKDMEEAIFFSNFSEFRRKVLLALREGLWEEIAQKGHEKFLKYHSETSRAEGVLDNISVRRNTQL